MKILAILGPGVFILAILGPLVLGMWLLILGLVYLFFRMLRTFRNLRPRWFWMLTLTIVLAFVIVAAISIYLFTVHPEFVSKSFGIHHLIYGTVCIANGKRVFVHFEPEKFHEKSEEPLVPIFKFKTWSEQFEYAVRSSVPYSAPESSCNNNMEEYEKAKLNKGCRLMRKPDHCFTQNGCGSSWFRVPKYFQYPGFEKCCNEHDRCYQDCTKTKMFCERKFFGCLMTQCHMKSFYFQNSMFKVVPLIYDDIEISGVDVCSECTIPSKPAKYGLKIQCLTDARTYYLSNAYFYCGKTTEMVGTQSMSIPTCTVLTLVVLVSNINRNIIEGNWYSSIELVDELNRQDTTYVGTLRKNKHELPVVFLPQRNCEAGSSIFCFTQKKIFVLCVHKKSKAVALVSSMHNTNRINANSYKPEIYKSYNANKSGVDSLYQKCTKYTTSRCCQRWPLATLDIKGINKGELVNTIRSQEKVTNFRKVGTIPYEALFDRKSVDRVPSLRTSKFRV